MTLTEKVLELEGCPLHYWEGGVETAPMVVFLHGACVDHRSFDPIVPVIAERYHVISLDNRGHGLSQPMGKPFTVPLAVEDTLAILDKMGVKKAVFVGHSNGTYIAQELAFRYPERVTALVIIGGTCITWKRSAFENWLVNFSPNLLRLYSYENLKKTSVPIMSDKKEVQEYNYNAYSMLTHEDFMTIWTGVTRCLHAEPDYNITQPLLLMHGDQDTTGDIRKIAPAWAAREPNCQYEVIPNAKHFATLDNPEFIIDKLQAFLAKWAPVK